MITEKTLAKKRKVQAAFMDLKKAYDKVNITKMWYVLKVFTW